MSLGPCARRLLHASLGEAPRADCLRGWIAEVAKLAPDEVEALRDRVFAVRLGRGAEAMAARFAPAKLPLTHGIEPGHAILLAALVLALPPVGPLVTPARALARLEELDVQEADLLDTLAVSAAQAGRANPSNGAHQQDALQLLSGLWSELAAHDARLGHRPGDPTPGWLSRLRSAIGGDGAEGQALRQLHLTLAVAHLSVD